jgi:transcriptional regulator with AAA-type ATPase domain/tetratricopeptide (TPR) repeat protein/predicted Ser/Thr protein kinase
MPRLPQPGTPEHPRYAVVRRLGSGGTGTVYLARDLLAGGREVALKVCRLDAPSERIQKEFRILRDLRHPGVARAYDFGRLKGNIAYFTLEHVAGPNLERESRALRRQMRLKGPSALIQLFLEVASALAYLHDKGLLHLDLKPANIVLGGGCAKLIDFDLFQRTSVPAGRITRGTAHFAAPEVLEGLPVDARADLYSLGAAMYRSFTGRHPTPGRGVAEIRARQRRSPPRPPPGIPEDLARVIVKLLAVSPERRFQTAGDLVRALGALLAASPEEGFRRTSGREEPDMVGRREELDALLTWLRGLEEGSESPVFLVSGEPGAGKSRFVEACETEMLLAGIQVMRLGGAGDEGQASLRRLVEKLITLRPLARAERSHHDFLLAALGISGDKRLRAAIGEFDLEHVRSRTAPEITEILTRATPPPLVLILEDLDRAGAEIRDFLRRFAAAAAASPLEGVAVLGTLRRSSLRGEPPLEEWSGVRHLRLPGLSREQCLEVAGQIAPAAPRADVVAVVREAGGNPGLLVRRLRWLSEGRHPRAAALPGGVLARDAFEELTPEARRLLLHLALLDRPVEERLVREAAGMRPAQFRAAKALLDERGFLRRTRGGVEIEPALGASVAATGSFSADDVRAAHESLGRVLIAAPRRRHEGASHLLRGGCVREGIAAAERAAAELRSAGRADEALGILLEAAEHASAPADLGGLLEPIGDLQEKCGRFDDAARSFEAMLGHAGRAPEDRLRVLRKLGGIHQRRGNSEAALRSFEEALGLEVEPAGAIEEHLHLFEELSALHLFRGDLPRATTFANRGLEVLASDLAASLPREAKARHALNLHSAAGHVHLRQFDYDRAAEEFHRGLAFAAEIGSLANASLILNNLGLAYGQGNRLRDALRAYDRASAIARRLGDGTALFSIQCNLATIRARLGDISGARASLEAAEAMPHASGSNRACLFLLHTRGLVARLTLEDARASWERSIRLADELPDPLFARYGRLCLLENEIHQGRWARAREVLSDLDALKGRDARLDRSVAARRALLEALCGRSADARMLLDGMLAVPSVRSYTDMWDEVCAAGALIELGEIARATAILEAAKAEFDRSHQAPSSFECSLLLAEAVLRGGDAGSAARWLRECRKAHAHEAGRSTRLGAVRLPYLEARLALMEGQDPRSQVNERLVDAAGNLPPRSTTEIAWLLDLVGAEVDAGLRRKMSAARRRFTAGLSTADRRTYLARDHRKRLGLARTAPAPASSASLRRYEALLAIARAGGLAEGLRAAVEGAGAARGAVFLEREGGAAASHGFSGAESLASLARLRDLAFRSLTGSLESGRVLELRSGGQPRIGLVYLEMGEGDIDREMDAFLHAAAGLLTLAAGRQSSSGPAAVQDAGSTTRIIVDAGTEPLDTTGLEESLSPRMRDVLTFVHRARDSRLPVLITGESGAGKDHLARWIHSIGPRARGPFVAQDCSSIPEGLFESEIFGHESGAFTGADAAKTGYIFAAAGGTYYLDNVDSLALEAQAKLLRVLEEGSVRPVGASVERPVDVRVVASSQRDLKDLCLRGHFRRDLYFRLAGICLHLPPLRERMEDLPVLLRAIQRRLPGRPLSFTPGAMMRLRTHAWPGNIRELESLLQRLALTADGRVDEERVAAVLGQTASAASYPRWTFEGKGYEEVIEEVKREYLLYLLERHGGNVDRIARELRTTRRNLYFRFSSAGIGVQELNAAREAGAAPPANGRRSSKRGLTPPGRTSSR